MLHIVQSNRLDALADAMLERWCGAATAEGLPAPDVVIVPSRGLERWLTCRIADRFGVCTNVEFRFAAAFLWSAFARALPAVSEKSPFDTDVTTLRVFAQLAHLPDDAAHAPLHDYLDAADATRRLELARRIAQAFSQYMVYRPDWLALWTQNRLAGLEPAATERWQQRLWRGLLDALGKVNVHHPKDEFFDVLARRGPAGILPGRLRVFALPDVPPLYAEILTALARHVDVEWYALNPCRSFWADIVSEKALARQRERDATAAAHAEVGHPLLASWGQQRRDQLGVLSACIGEDATQDEDRFIEPRADTLLGRLQASILDLAEPAGVGDMSDGSIQIHDCHSLTRQLEVLHDQLLARFDADATLTGSDVAVFVPDIDAAAPIIDAVFGAAPPARRIPYTITGRARAEGIPLMQAAEFLLGLPDSRFEVAEVLAFLEIPAVMRRYELDSAELDTIQRWLREAGARWALDAAQREKLGLPAEPRHTWCDALYRLLVGYAMPTGTEQLVLGVLPYGELEGSQARTLGKLVRLVGDLARAAGDLATPRALADWPALVAKVVNTSTLATPDDLRDQERLRGALADLASDAQAAAPDEPVGCDVIRALVRARLQSSAPGATPSGRVTFTGIGPLRGIPFRVIALLGLEAEAFPRNPARLELDLRNAQPRKGDRSRRDDDRGAFLDALMAAQDALYLSYTGRSIRDNATLPPSVLVSELLDYLGRHHERGRDGAAAALVHRHPLQPFNARYFTADSGFFSYDADVLPAARGLARPFKNRLEMRPLFDNVRLPEPEPDARRVPLDELVWFYRNPVAKLMRRVGVRLVEAREEIGADEPFVLDDFDLRDQMLEWRLAGRPLEDCIALAAATPHVPHGQWGRQRLVGLASEIDAFATQVQAARGAPPLPPQPFELAVGPYTLWGTLRGFDRDGLFGYSLREEGVHDLLGAWLKHLVLCAAKPPGAALHTRVLLPKGGFAFGSVEQPLPILHTLLDHYWAGLSAPIPFFPKTSYAYLRKGEDAAGKAWRGSADRDPGERDKRWYRLVLGGAPDPLPDGLAVCAEAILGPMLASRRDLDPPAVEAA